MNVNTRKRTHLKSNQVAILQQSYENNPLPDSSLRSKLARELSVTERTIQIWFQNRRAKSRKIDSRPSKNYHRQYSTPPRYQATFRTMMTPERFAHQEIRKRPRSVSKPEPKSSDLLMEIEQINANRAMSEGVHNVVIQDDLLNMIPLPVSVLRIGTWTRFAHIKPDSHQKDWDLVCYCNPIKKEFVWKIQLQSNQFKIQVKFDQIQQIRLGQQIQLETGDLVGQLDFELKQNNNGSDLLSMLPSLDFFMAQGDEWIQCGDFTADKQASLNRIHSLQGNHEFFKQSLLDLISLAPELASKLYITPNFQQNLMLQAPFIYNQQEEEQDNLYHLMLQSTPSSFLL